MKRWINSNEGYEEYDTEEYTIFKERVRERIKDKIVDIQVKTNLFHKDKIVFKILSMDKKVGELNIEYDTDDFVGYSFFMGEGLPFGGFFEINKNSLRYLLVNSKLDGWSIEDKRNISHSIFMFSGRQDILTNENDNFNIVKQDTNKEIIAVPLKNKIRTIYEKFLKKNEYDLVFRDKKEVETLTSMLLFREREKIIFKGMEEWESEIPCLDDEDRKNWYLRIYFLLNDKYKIIIEYDSSSYVNNYMFVKNNKLRDYRSEHDSVFLWNSNNSEFKRSSYEKDFYYESYNRECLSHCYITDDYRVEIIVTSLDYLPNILILDQEGNEVLEDEIFISEELEGRI